MPWRSVAVSAQRLEFCRLALAGTVPVAELCRRFGISRQTAYKWLRRFEAEGPPGLVDRPRKPHTSPTRTSAEIEALVLKVRKKHQAFGGRKIRNWLLRHGHVGVPAASTITAILRRHGQLPERPPKRAYGSFEYPAPNELWQMDFKGQIQLTSGAEMFPLSALDDHSRFNLFLAACPNQRGVTVKSQLTGAFSVYGLPEAMLMDNGSPWGRSVGQDWTPFTLWLVDLGIHVIHSTPGHPETLGKQERFHKTLDLEVLTTQPRWNSFAEVQAAFDWWRTIYNYHRPHDALPGETTAPTDRYQPSPRPMPEQIDPPEYDAGTDVRKASSDGRFSWRGRLWRAGKPFAGKHLGIRPTTTESQYAVYYRHQQIRTITLT